MGDQNIVPAGTATAQPTPPPANQGLPQDPDDNTGEGVPYPGPGNKFLEKSPAS